MKHTRACRLGRSKKNFINFKLLKKLILFTLIKATSTGTMPRRKRSGISWRKIGIASAWKLKLNGKFLCSPLVHRKRDLKTIILRLSIDPIKGSCNLTLCMHVNDCNIFQIAFLSMMGHGLEKNIWSGSSALREHNIA